MMIVICNKNEEFFCINKGDHEDQTKGAQGVEQYNMPGTYTAEATS